MCIYDLIARFWKPHALYEWMCITFYYIWQKCESVVRYCWPGVYAIHDAQQSVSLCGIIIFVWITHLISHIQPYSQVACFFYFICTTPDWEIWNRLFLSYFFIVIRARFIHSNSFVYYVFFAPKYFPYKMIAIIYKTSIEDYLVIFSLEILENIVTMTMQCFFFGTKKWRLIE